MQNPWRQGFYLLIPHGVSGAQNSAWHILIQFAESMTKLRWFCDYSITWRNSTTLVCELRRMKGPGRTVSARPSHFVWGKGKNQYCQCCLINIVIFCLLWMFCTAFKIKYCIKRLFISLMSFTCPLQCSASAMRGVHRALELTTEYALIDWESLEDPLYPSPGGSRMVLITQRVQEGDPLSVIFWRDLWTQCQKWGLPDRQVRFGTGP